MRVPAENGSPERSAPIIVAPTGASNSQEARLLGAGQLGGVDPSQTIAHWVSGSLVGTDNSADAGHPGVLAPPDTIDQSLGGPQVFWAASESGWPLEQLAARFPEARFLLFYAPPKAALANALAHGIDLWEALEYWLSANCQLLRFQRHHRSRSVLLDATAAVRYPAALFEVLAQFGVDAKPDLNYLPAEAGSGSAGLAIEQEIAERFLQAQSEPAPLAAELEARATPLGEAVTDEKPGPVAVYRAYTDWRKRFAEQAQRVEAEREARETAESRAAWLEQRVEELEKAQREQEQSLQEKASHLEAETEAKQAAESRTEEAQQENELLLQQLHQVQEELEGYYLKYQELEQSSAEVTKERERLEQRVEELEKAQREQAQSLQEKASHLEAETEAKQAAESRTEEAQQENELLLQQLHQVQEELEDYYLKYQELITKAESSEEDDTTHTGSDGAEADQSPQQHEVLSWRQRRKRKKKERAQAQLIRKSDLFDADWYRQEYPDVAESGMKPELHFLRFGAHEGRDPSPGFKTRVYLDANPDVAESGMNPLVHYIRFGREEGRSPVDGEELW